MNVVMDIETYRKAKESKIASYSLLDLILDPQKREQSDKYYIQNYKYIEKDDFAKKIFNKSNIREDD